MAHLLNNDIIRKKGRSTIMEYTTTQVVLKEKFLGHNAKNLSELDNTLNRYAREGWRLDFMTTTVAGNTGLGGGDRTVFTLVFVR